MKELFIIIIIIIIIISTKRIWKILRSCFCR